MTEEQRPEEGIESGQPAGQGGAPTPDLMDLLGPEAVETIGNVAEEAFKLFSVARERFGGALTEAAEPEEAPAPGAGTGAAGSPWAGLLSQFAAGAVKAVEDFAVAAQEEQQRIRAAAQEPAPADEPPEPVAADTAPGAASASGPSESSGTVHPGQAASCSYCPICQGIALVRSVPTETWQRLAMSVVEMADAAKDVAEATDSAARSAASGTPVPRPVVIRQEEGLQDGPSAEGVADFLHDLDAGTEPPPQRDED